MNEDEKGRIESLNEKLNSRTRYRDPLETRRQIREGQPVDVAEDWQGPELEEILQRERQPVRINSMMKKIFIFALIFCLVAVAVATLVFRGGFNFVSSKNVDINVLGPTVASAGEVLELGVGILNSNNADLEFANFSIQYPTGSRNPDNSAETLTFTKDDLGVVKAGVEAVRNVRMVLLGSIGEVKEIKFSLEYKVKGSNATFYKDKIFEVTLGEVPISLTIDSPAFVTSGETFTTNVSVVLQSSEILKNVVVRAEYPYGYSVTNSSPQSTVDNNVWVLGDLPPGEKKTIAITGRLLGEDQEERTARFYAGVSDGSGSANIRIVIDSALQTTSIKRQNVSLSVLLNGENAPVYTAPAGRPINATVRFQNNLPDRLLNPRLELNLSGLALDPSSISPGNNGFYDQANAKVVWNLTNLGGNPELAPGDRGQVAFRFSSFPAQLLSEGVGDIRLNFTVTGTPTSGVGQGVVTVSESRTVRISSNVNFLSKVLHSVGSFANSGPIPPKEGQETTYTVVWNVGNTQGDLLNARVTARLGEGVRYIGASSFVSENVSHDASSNIVTWNMGTLLSETGFSSTAREVSFQIGLTPSVDQIGTAPALVNNILFSGRDSFSNNQVSVSAPPLTTALPNDPVFIQGDDIVVKQ